MPLYIPWLTETIKKRGVRYLLHHYLGQFFIEKLDLNQLSVDIYAGKGSIDNLLLDVNGLNDELDFIPFKFLDGCSIGLISVEVPWSSLSTDACKVELESAKFVCQLKTSSDNNRTHCTESTLLTRSLMTTSMQMAEDIVTTEDEEYESPSASFYNQSSTPVGRGPTAPASHGLSSKSKDIANQTFEGLEMFAQLIDSVLRRTKLTARNTLFQIRPRPTSDNETENDDERNSEEDTSDHLNRSCKSVDETLDDDANTSEGTVEFFIKFFRCEEIMEAGESGSDNADSQPTPGGSSASSGGLRNDSVNSTSEANSSSHQASGVSMPETITKLLTLEDVEMRIGGEPVSNLVGKHTIMIKFNGQKSEISIYSGSPLLAVIGHEQLKVFFNVFDASRGAQDDQDSCDIDDDNQKVMSAEDYAKIENQLLQAANRTSSGLPRTSMGEDDRSSHFLSNPGIVGAGGRRWVGGTNLNQHLDEQYGNFNSTNPIQDHHLFAQDEPHGFPNTDSCLATETSLDHLDAFSCELKLPGIWLCLLKSSDGMPPLIKPYADSINSFETIDKYIDQYIKVPHIRLLALKVALNLTSSGVNVFLGDLNISEHLHNSSIHSTIRLLEKDSIDQSINTPRYRAQIKNNKTIIVDSLVDTRMTIDPTMIDRLVYEYKLFQKDPPPPTKSDSSDKMSHLNISRRPLSKQSTDLSLSIKSPGQLKIELLCPIPDLTPEAHLKPTQIRPQSFIFDMSDVDISFKSEKLQLTASDLIVSVKSQSQQRDSDAVEFVRSNCKTSDKIQLTIETSPSNLDSNFPNEINQALQESSMMDSIYVSQATESKIPAEAFQTKRKVVRGKSSSSQSGEANKDKCDSEKILTPADRQHLLDYLSQTVIATKLSVDLHLPNCDVEFEDKEQLDLIYNRFGNDFVFWKPKIVTNNLSQPSAGFKCDNLGPEFKDSHDVNDESNDVIDCDLGLDRNRHQDTENKYHSLDVDDLDTVDFYDNEVTCKVTCDKLTVRFNHQSCAAAMSQEISSENFLLGLIIDVNKKPNTVLSLVADDFQLYTDSEPVLSGNQFSCCDSIFALTAEIKRPKVELKDIKLAIQLNNALLDNFVTETFTRFWQSISVTDEPVLGYLAPKLVTELHVNILDTALSVSREGVRPALLTIDELYLTSMVMQKTSQVMIRIVADEVSLYLRRSMIIGPLQDSMKNYICLIDSGLIDLDLKLTQDGKVEFGMVNNVITVRACHDSLSDLFELFRSLVKSNSKQMDQQQPDEQVDATESSYHFDDADHDRHHHHHHHHQRGSPSQVSTEFGELRNSRPAAGTHAAPAYASSETRHQANTNKSEPKLETNLLEDAMNDFSASSCLSLQDDDDRSSCFSSESESDRSDDNDDDDDEQDDGGDEEGQSEDSNNNNSDDEEVAADDGASSEHSVGDDDDDDGLPMIYHAASDSPGDESDSPSGRLGPMKAGVSRGACLLDESNPLLGDLFSQPLLPLPNAANTDDIGESATHNAASLLAENVPIEPQPLSVGQASQESSLDESKFFVIGDDDVGAGIRAQNHGQEPVIRKLIDGPINIVDNHFKMTSPKTIPEILASSLERYVLEEMTLVVILYGGHDFDEADKIGPSCDIIKQEQKVAPDSNPMASGKAALSRQKSESSSAYDTIATASSSLDNLSLASGIAGVQQQESGKQQSSNRPPSRPRQSLSRHGRLSDSSAGPGLASSQAPAHASPSLGLANKQQQRGNRKKHFSESSKETTAAGARSGAAGGGPHQAASSSGLRSQSGEGLRVRFGEGAVNLWESLDLMSAPDLLGPQKARGQSMSAHSKQLGGTWRQTDVSIQLTLSKVKLLYEIGDTTATPAAAAQLDSLAAPILRRFMLFIEDIEIKDRVLASDINKMLYEYCNESMPKRNAPMLTVKSVTTINKTDGCEECDLKVSLKPLRLNIDQDTLLFLIDFFTTISSSMARDSLELGARAKPSSCSGKPVTPPSQSQSMSKRQKQKHQRLSSQMSSDQQQPPISEKSSSPTVEDEINLHHHRVAATSSKTTASKYQAETSTASQASKPADEAFEARRASTESRDSRGANSSFKSCVSSSSSCSVGVGAVGCVAAASEGSTSSRRKAGHAAPGSSGRAQKHRLASTTKGQGSASGAKTNRKRRRRDSEYSKQRSERRKSRHLEQQQRQHGRQVTSATDSSGPETSGEPSGRQGGESPPTCCHTDSPNQASSTYIKSFSFSPDVPIRLDYHAKHLDFEQGALAGILMGLAHLDHSELVLKRLQAKHGMRGLDRVLLFALNHWLSDIKRNQLHTLLGGVGPMHSMIQLVQGIRDLVWMPIEHYRRDRRLVRGLQRGAASFSSSTAMAAISLVNRFISIIQCTAQIAHDIVTPPGNLRLDSSSGGGAVGGPSGGAGGAAASRRSQSSLHHHHQHRHHNSSSSGNNNNTHYHATGDHRGAAAGGTGSPKVPRGAHFCSDRQHSAACGCSSHNAAAAAAAGGQLNQPRNFCEGLAVGFSILKDGINDTARNVAVGMQAEDMRSAVGELVRQIPSTFLSPIISVTEGAQNVLVGMRNQIAPDARREDQEKWKRRVRGK